MTLLAGVKCYYTSVKYENVAHILTKFETQNCGQHNMFVQNLYNVMFWDGREGKEEETLLYPPSD